MSSIEQQIDRAELVAEAGHAVVTQRVDHLVGELLARDIADRGLRFAALHLVADGVHEMGLAHAGAAVEEERVVGLRGPLGDCAGGGAGKLVAVADDEGVKGVPRVQLCRRGPVETPLLRGTLRP